MPNHDRPVLGRVAASLLARVRGLLPLRVFGAWRSTRAALFVMTGVLLIAGTGGEAGAHAFLMDTDPADRSRLEASPPEIRLTFNEPVTPILIQLLDAADRPVAGGGPAARPDGTLRLALPQPVPVGLYTISYRVTSADGHPTTGTLLFGVGVTPPPPGDGAVAGGAEGVTALALAAVVVRALHYGTLLAGIGGGLFLMLVSGRWSPMTRRLRPGLGLILLVAGVSAILLVGLTGVVLNGSDAGALASPNAWAEGWTTGWASSAGSSAAVALLALLVVAVGLALEAEHRVGRVLLLLGALLGAVSLALTGHAATAPPRWLSAPLVALHGLMAAVWVGALWPLAVALRTEPASEAARLTRRFSRVAVVAVALLAAVGAVLSVLQIERPAAVVNTGYGWLWMGKMVAVGILLALAACNRLWLTPALDVGGAPAAAVLRRSVLVEMAVAAAALLLTAAFGLTPPPRASNAPEAVAPAEAEPVRQAGYATSISRGGLVALVEVIPARPGPNRVAVHLSLPDGRPVVPAEATVEWSLPAAGATPIHRPLAASAAGALGADDVVLPMGGRWSLQLEIRDGTAGSVAFRTEVPVPLEDREGEAKP